MSDKKPSYRAPAFAWLAPIVADVARPFGYAIAIHGSMHRDFDLVAIPWVEDAAEPAVLIEAIRKEVGGTVIETGTVGGRWNPEIGGFESAIVENPSLKPHGRLAWNIHMEGGFTLDVSVMPSSPPPAESPS